MIAIFDMVVMPRLKLVPNCLSVVCCAREDHLYDGVLNSASGMELWHQRYEEKCIRFPCTSEALSLFVRA
jgi:hypothetical protein